MRPTIVPHGGPSRKHLRAYQEHGPVSLQSAVEADTAVLYVMREDGSTVAAFSTLGFTREGIIEVVAQDRWGKS